jgi:hypothetical protein
MTRTLTFDSPKAALRFEMLRAAMLAGGDGKGDRTPIMIRKEARIQKALEAISDPVPSGRPQRRVSDLEEVRVLRNHGPQTLELAQEDFELLQQYSEKVQWNPRVSCEVVELWDWLSAAERVE